jgi:hypothetical protein
MKRTLLATLALSAICFAALMAPLVYGYPYNYAMGYDDNCVCDHYQNEAWMNTPYDEYTATGLHAVYANAWSYSSVHWIYNRGVGNLGLINTYSMDCYYKWYPYTYGTTYNYYSSSWVGPAPPWPGAYDGYYCQYYEMTVYNVGGQASGSTGSWYNAPFYPYDAWYDYGRVIPVYPSS